MLHSAQWNVVASCRNEWLEKGAPAAQEIAGRIYRSIGFPEPLVYVLPSPLSALLAIPHLIAAHGKGSVFQDLLDPITNRNGLTNQVDDRFRVGGQLSDGLRLPVNGLLNSEVLNWFTDWICGVLRDLGGDKLVSDRMAAGLFDEKAIDRSWWTRISASQAWWWPYPDFMVFALRPVEIHVESVRGLHRDDGPAAAFGDGFKIYAVSGVPVSERIIMRPETITLDEIDHEENGEIRRVLISKMGPGKYLKDSGATLLDMDSLTLVGSAPRALMVDKRGQKWLIGTDGSTARVYSMPVPEHVETCVEAHNAISGFSESKLIAEA